MIDSDAGDETSELLTDETDCFLEEKLVATLMNPAARTRRVWERNHNRLPASVVDCLLCTDQLRQRNVRKKPLNRQPAHWNQNRRLNDLQLCLEPIGAARLLLTARNAVPSPAGVWSRVAARDSRDVNGLARRDLVDSRSGEPTKESLSRSARKRYSTFGLHLSGSLTHEHHLRIGRLREDRPNPRAELAALTHAKCEAMLC